MFIIRLKLACEWFNDYVTWQDSDTMKFIMVQAKSEYATISIEQFICKRRQGIPEIINKGIQYCTSYRYRSINNKYTKKLIKYTKL